MCGRGSSSHRFVSTRLARRAYREVLVGAIAHPLRSRIRHGARQPPPSGQRCSFPPNNLIDRAN
jgi:hypothetical protein